MDPQALAELGTLRARAYSPDADIFGDAAALERLNELEARALARHAKPADEQSAAAQHPEPALAAEDEPEAPDAAGSAVAEDAGEPGPRSSRWSRRRLIMAGAASLLVVVVVTAFVTSFVARRAGYDASVEAVLVEDPSYEFPADLWGGPVADAVGFATFFGMRPAAPSYIDPAEGRCIVVYDESIEFTSSGYNGMVFQNCGVDPFPAEVAMRVGPDSPQELRERFPDGTALQFVLEGSEVVVLSGAAADTPAATPSG